MLEKLVEGYFIKTLDNLIFEVKGVIHPNDRIIAYVRYVPNIVSSDSVPRFQKIYDLYEREKYLKDNIHVIVDKLKEDSEDTAYYFVEVLDYMREMLHSLTFINYPAYQHVDNNHKPLIEEQIEELKSPSLVTEEEIEKTED